MRVFVSNFNGVFDPLIAFLKIKGDLTPNWFDADVVLLWQDVIGDMPEIAKTARDNGKRVYVAEHGLLSINDYLPPLSRKLEANAILTWGERSKRWLIEKAGIEPSRVKVVGTTIFDDFKPRRLHKGRNVLFAPRHWSPELEENKIIANEIRKLKGVHVYSKIVEGEHDPNDYPNPIPSNRLTGDHLYRCWQALSEADVLVTLGEGTIASLAYYLDIPVISADIWKEKELLGKTYTHEEFFSQVSNACTVTSIDNLNGEIMFALDNPDDKREQRYEFLVDNINYNSETTALENFLKVIYEGA